MKFAYADPPYLACCSLYKHEHGTDGLCWDEPATHHRLITHLSVDFPDGWAMSASSPSLQSLLVMCPNDARVAAWVKPFASFKPNVNPAYAWEPVIWYGGRQHRERTEPTVRDWFSGNITLQRGLTGAKSERFCLWILDLLGFKDGDEIVDLYPGTGVMDRAVRLHSQRLQYLEIAEARLLEVNLG